MRAKIFVDRDERKAQVVLDTEYGPIDISKYVHFVTFSCDAQFDLELGLYLYLPVELDVNVPITEESEKIVQKIVEAKANGKQ